MFNEGHNQACRIRPLRKAYWPKLKNLELTDNYIGDAAILSELFSKKLTLFYPEACGRVQLHDLRPMVKLESSVIEHICTK